MDRVNVWERSDLNDEIESVEVESEEVSLDNEQPS